MIPSVRFIDFEGLHQSRTDIPTDSRCMSTSAMMKTARGAVIGRLRQFRPTMISRAATARSTTGRNKRRQSPSRREVRPKSSRRGGPAATGPRAQRADTRAPAAGRSSSELPSKGFPRPPPSQIRTAFRGYAMPADQIGSAAEGIRGTWRARWRWPRWPRIQLRETSAGKGK